MSLVSLGSRESQHTHCRNRTSWVPEGRLGGLVSLVSCFLDLFACVRAHMHMRVREAAAGGLTKLLRLTGSNRPAVQLSTNEALGPIAAGEGR